MVRLKDIAQVTGLTVSTVSKALNHSREISAETSAKVMEAARSLGYISKREMRKDSKTIGVILPEVESHYYALLMQILSREIESRGYEMITMLTSSFSSDPGPYIGKMSQYGLAGMILCCGFSFSEEAYQLLLQTGIPTLLLNEGDRMLPMIDSIYISVKYGVNLAVEHLLELGHRKIGYLGEYFSDERYQFFCESMKRYHLEVNPDFIRRTKTRFEEGGYELACELLREKELPTAIVVCYDQVAFGAMRAFREYGVRIPEDISIVSFDNIAMDEYYPIPLTSVVNPVGQMGITAVKILLDAVTKGKEHVVQNVSLQSRLIIRNSTCPPVKRDST